MSYSTTPWTVDGKLLCPPIYRGLCSNSYLLSQWYYPTILSFATLFFFCPQTFPAPGFFNWVSSSHQMAKVLELPLQHQSLPMNTQCWFPLGLTSLISLQSKGLSRVFFSTAIWKHELFGTHHFLWSNSHIWTWLLKKIIALTIWSKDCWQSNVFAFYSAV